MARFKRKKDILRIEFRAFSLTELLVVLIIMGILVLIALPNFLPKITEAKAQEAKIQLKHLYTLEKSHFYMYSKYTNDFDEIGFVQPQLVSEGGSANYAIEVVEFEHDYFIAQATSVTDFDGDGIYNKWQIDQDQNLKEIQKD